MSDARNRKCRDVVASFLTEAERESASRREPTRLREGEEYVDLRHLDRGVRRALATLTVTANALPRRAVHDDAWRKIVRYLAEYRMTSSHASL